MSTKSFPLTFRLPFRWNVTEGTFDLQGSYAYVETCTRDVCVHVSACVCVPTALNSHSSSCYITAQNSMHTIYSMLNNALLMLLVVFCCTNKCRGHTNVVCNVGCRASVSKWFRTISILCHLPGGMNAAPHGAAFSATIHRTLCSE